MTSCKPLSFSRRTLHHGVSNLYAPCILYIGQTCRSPPQYSYIFSQQIYLIIFLDFLSPSSFIPPQNSMHLLMLPFLVHTIFTFYINDVLNCKCPAPGPKGKYNVCLKIILGHLVFKVPRKIRIMSLLIYNWLLKAFR